MKQTIIGALLIAAAALAAGCGGDDSPAPTPTRAAETMEVSIFFAKADATGHVEVVRQVPASEDLLRPAIEAVIDGPTEAEKAQHSVISVIPAGTRLLSAEVSGGAATLDFSTEMLDYGGGSALVMAITGSIELTATAIPGIDSVVILVAGEPDALQP